VTIPYDFIIWNRLVNNYRRFRFKHPLKYVVNCDHPLQIKFHQYFVANYINKQRRNIQRENKFIYKPTPVKKDKIIIPETIREQWFQINATKKISPLIQHNNSTSN
jgi:hypothetical protein